MPVAHKDLTGVHLHEPKGVDTAVAGSVYQADGSGSGVWTPLDIPEGTFTIQQSVFTGGGTWTKPTGAFLIRVYAQGGGQGGGSAGNNGNSTTFGSYLTATGGGAGVGSSGDINTTNNGRNMVVSTAYAGGDTPTVTDRHSRTLDQAIPFARINGGTGTSENTGNNGNCSIKTFAASDLTNTVAVSIGTGGTAAGAGTGAAGTAGVVYVESYVLT